MDGCVKQGMQLVGLWHLLGVLSPFAVQTVELATWAVRTSLFSQAFPRACTALPPWLPPILGMPFLMVASVCFNSGWLWSCVQFQ